MANRFLETNYYKSPFVRALRGPLKGLYSFIICDCTASGVWPVDVEIASMYIGFQISIQDFEENFIKTGKAIEISNGKYFFPDFIEHQYPSGLQSWNKSHNKIIIELKGLGFLREENITREVRGKSEPGILYFVKKGALKGLPSPYGNGQGNSNGIGNGEGQGNTVTDEKYLIPEMFIVFKNHIPSYPGMIEKDFKPLKSIADFILLQLGLKFNIATNTVPILAEWEKLCAVVAADKFYKKKPLTTINNQIQEIYQISKDGNKATGRSTGQGSGKHQSKGEGGY